MMDPAHGPSSTPPGTREGDERASPSPILLYDGLCGFCDATIQIILRRDPHGPMRFALLPGTTATAILGRHPELRGVDSLLLVEGSGADENAFIRSEAALRIGRYLGGAWGLLTVLRVVPGPIRDWGYALFARHRHRVLGRYEECPVPAPEVRSRFLP